LGLNNRTVVRTGRRCGINKWNTQREKNKKSTAFPSVGGQGLKDEPSRNLNLR